MSDLDAQATTSRSPAAYGPADGAPEARGIFALQRQLLLRARGALFDRLAALGGVPTIADDDVQAALDARATRDMSLALRPVLGDAFAHGSLAVAHREYWAARAPAMLCFGARLHGALARLVVRPGSDERAVRAMRAVALFQLAASLLDWIGDDHGGGAEVARLLPIGELRPLVRDARGRDGLRRRAQDCGGATRAFATVLIALLESVARLPMEATAFAALLGAAYDAELESFAPWATLPSEREACARAKSELPTLVCGSIASAGLVDRDRMTVERAAAAIAPLLGILDDMADLGDDLRTGQLNTLVPACARDDASVAGAMRELLAGDTIERLAGDAAACIERVHAIALAAGVPAVERHATVQWLRTRAWRWLS